MKRTLATVAAATLMLGACTTTGTSTSSTTGVGTKQLGGAAIGAAAGGLVGSQFGKGQGQLVTTALGAVLGGLVGSQAGASLDRADQVYLNQTTQASLENQPDGSRVRWQNPNNNHYGYVQPIRTYESQGQPCREFRQSFNVNGRTETATGTACRNSDGTWTIINT